MKSRALLIPFLLLATIGIGPIVRPAQPAKITLIYSSDLYFPPDDPDDWFDLATLFATPGISIGGIILDQQLYDRRPESEGTGVIPLRQISAIAGRSAPFAIGLRTALKDVEDKGLDQPAVCQKGVEMILNLLAKAEGSVVLLTVGTARDIAAAYNRDPGLFRRKVAKIYLNAGIYGFPEGRIDVNLLKDKNAFIAIMKSGLPVYWAPCFGEDGHETYWQADQGKLLDGATVKLQNYFLYAFSKGTGIISPAVGQKIVDPVTFLNRPRDAAELRKLYGTRRNMWSTASFLDAAGLNIYENNHGDYAASRHPVGAFTREARPFSFKKMKLFIDDQGRVHAGRAGTIEVFVFCRSDGDEYRRSLESILKNMFSGSFR